MKTDNINSQKEEEEHTNVIEKSMLTSETERKPGKACLKEGMLSCADCCLRLN